jgi:small GTP-binding protein
MTVWERKVCMLGGAGTGKTSLVRRFVEGLFSERYLSTIGVKIDRKTLIAGSHTVNLALWDIEGDTDSRETRLRYLRGAAGVILVVDGTDPGSLALARGLHGRVADRRPDLPFVLALNKADLTDQWRIADPDLEPLRLLLGEPVRTSALTGEGVESMFRALAPRLVPTRGG